MGDWTDLVGKLVDKAAILDSNVVNPQSTPNHCIPSAAGSVTNLRGWVQDPEDLWDDYQTVAREIPLVGGTLVTPNHIRYGVSWRYGGRWEGKGRYIRDAFAWVRVYGIGAAQSFDVTADWRDPEYDGPEDDPIGIITCDIKVKWEQFWMTDQQWTAHFIMKGDGSGRWDYIG